jgi:hypothetical protein
MSYDKNADDNRTARVAFLSVATIILGFMLFLFKVDACQGCDNSPSGTCHEQFFEFDKDHTTRTCPPRSKAELVSSPPAPKAGVICRCIDNAQPTPSAPQPAPSK